MRPVFIKLHGSFCSVFLVKLLSDFGAVFLLVFFVLFLVLHSVLVVCLFFVYIISDFLCIL